MTLIVETGAGDDPDANSYVSRADAIAYAGERGVTLADTEATDALAIQAMDYLSMQRWLGVRTYPLQPLDWPRTIECFPLGTLPKDVVPNSIVKAQCALIMYASQGIVLVPTKAAGSEKFVISKKLGPIETTYSEAVALNASNTPSMPIVNVLLRPFIEGGAGPTRSYRV